MPKAAKTFRATHKARVKRKWDSSMPCRVYHRLYGLQAWKQLRHSHLAANPLCVECLRDNKRRVATVVDHVEPHRGNLDLFFDTTNLQSLCKLHHDRKTAIENVSFKIA